jgi:diaminohydroxyphosphoribosylaminopyrimidine deaminase/5-amino-6-(5-phosphoribosylamino)uracil reductase
MMERVDGDMMAAAIAAAGDHHPHPNPRVGAVVVTGDGRIVGRGGHRGPGTPHAEVVALDEAGPATRGATLYVTLEPCAHQGRTSPCTDAIIAAGITRVVAALEDPDARVAGRGFAALRGSDIEVVTGVGREPAGDLDPGYFHHRRTGRPRVTLKVGMTLDGQVAAADGSSQWITSIEARRDAHHLRSAHDAILVGAGTLQADDPELTVRLDGYSGPQPLPVVVAGRRAVPPARRVFERTALVFSPTDCDVPAEVVVLPDSGREQVDLPAMLDALGNRGIVDLLVEGGPRLATAMWKQGLVDHGVVYLASALAGGSGRPVFTGSFATVADLQAVHFTRIEPVGPDVRIDFEGAV